MKFYKYFIIALLIEMAYGEDEDFIDRENEPDDEAFLKCDACKVIATKFSESFSSAQLTAQRPILNDDEILDAIDSTCDDPWEGYGIKVLDGVSRLDGPNAEKSIKEAPGIMARDDGLWSRRLQDMCDELLAETPDEKSLFKLWSSDAEALEKYLCYGEGLYGACSGDDWGSWPGDDYDDYDDFDDFEYVHDEF